MRIACKKCQETSPGTSSDKLGRGTSWIHKLCRSICCVSPSTNGEGSGSSLEDELETDAEEDNFPDSTEGLSSTTAQDVPLPLLVERDSDTQCHESDSVQPNTDSTQANGSLSPVDVHGTSLRMTLFKKTSINAILVRSVSLSQSTRGHSDLCTGD